MPGVAIASKLSVRSILLVSKVPLEKIRSVALDNSSLTSVALVQSPVREMVGRDEVRFMAVLIWKGCCSSMTRRW